MKTVAEILRKEFRFGKRKLSAKKNRFDENCRGNFSGKNFSSAKKIVSMQTVAENSAERIFVQQEKLCAKKNPFR
jgi:hypothetical protein